MLGYEFYENYGLEFSYSQPFLDNWQFSSKYSYQDKSHDEDYPLFGSRQDQMESLRFNMLKSMGACWSLNLGLIFNDSKSTISIYKRRSNNFSTNKLSMLQMMMQYLKHINFDSDNCWLGINGLTQEQIGVASAVNKNTTDLSLEQERKLIDAGYEIIQNHTIETDEIGRAQMLLLDGTAFSVGPNSSVVLDKFIYNPDTAEGSLRSQHAVC